MQEYRDRAGEIHREFTSAEGQLRREMRQSIGSARGETLVRQIKVGRNDPCPCGSGLKFKKCCITRVNIYK
jgi:uncharacterized protein YecA (UPF0149 family)